jgi:nucleoid DNA-binding protein
MNNKEFLSELSKRMGMSNRQTRTYITSLLGIMGDTFIEGDSIQVVDFGTFEVKKKLERIVVIPATGQRMLVPPKFVLGFKPFGTLKEKIINGGVNDGTVGIE